MQHLVIKYIMQARRPGLKQSRDGTVAQSVVRQTGMLLTQVQVPGEARDFSPSHLSVQTLSQCPYTPVCNCIH